MDTAEVTIAELKRRLARRSVAEALLSACEADAREGVRELAAACRRRAADRAREAARLRRLYALEVQLGRTESHAVGGVDEVGRGPLAGPVVAACVILPPRPKLTGLDDSKAVPAEARARLDREIRKVALGVGLGVVQPGEIDERNIYRASLYAMELAIAACAPARPTYLLLDAVKLKGHPLPHQGIVGGDGKIACIAAASIVAKVARDAMMEQLDLLHPGYGFAIHKGYGTPHHLEKLRALGATPVHRRSFAPVRAALGLVRSRSPAAADRALEERSRPLADTPTEQQQLTGGDAVADEE